MTTNQQQPPQHQQQIIDEQTQSAVIYTENNEKNEKRELNITKCENFMLNPLGYYILSNDIPFTVKNPIPRESCPNFDFKSLHDFINPFRNGPFFCAVEVQQTQDPVLVYEDLDDYNDMNGRFFVYSNKVRKSILNDKNTKIVIFPFNSSRYVFVNSSNDL